MAVFLITASETQHEVAGHQPADIYQVRFGTVFVIKWIFSP